MILLLYLQFNIENPYTEEKEYINYEDSIVIKELWYDSVYLGMKEVYSLRSYFEKGMKELLKKAVQEEVKEYLSSHSEGYSGDELIKEMEIPTILGGESKIDIDGGDNITVGASKTMVSSDTATKSGPNFMPELKVEQSLNVIVNAQIESKIHATIDYSTDRLTDAENNVKLWYEGDEDEIIKKIELGNTSLELPKGAGYISQLPASQGLFGISGHYQLGSVDIRSIFTYEQSDVGEKEFTGTVQTTVDTIYDYEFMRNKFFYIPEEDSIVDIYVYIHKSYPQEPFYNAIATVFPDYPDSVPPYEFDRVSTYFNRLEKNKDFYFYASSNILELNQPLTKDEALGVWYIRSSGDTVGGYIHNDSLVLRLLWTTMPDTSSETWSLQLRNIYYVGISDESAINLTIFRDNKDEANDVEYETEGENKGRTFIDILGLDPDGNGLIDYPYYDQERGYLIFPLSQPFMYEGLSQKDEEIYYKEELTGGEGGLYYMVIEMQTTVSKYTLVPGIKENSEKVFVDGKEQVRDQDYRINYYTGELTFINPVPPNAHIKVTYEMQPLFQVERYSLIGASMETPLGTNKENKFLFGIYHRAKSVPDREVPIRRTPFSRTIMEGSINYSLKMEPIDRVMKFLKSKKESSLKLSSSGAISIPNPNTRGEAYIENFESESSVNVTTSMRDWMYTSLPADKDTTDFSRNRLIWVDENIKKEDIFGEEAQTASYSTERILKVIYKPEDGNKWSGIMTATGTSENLENVEEVEIVIKTIRNQGTFHLDVGTSMDEDQLILDKNGNFFGIGEYNTEDKNHDGKLDIDEDTGIDGVSGDDDLWPSIEGDLGNDDYELNNPNGTEGNQRLDSEDMDDNGSFTSYNNYYEYSFTLEGDNVKNLENGWKIVKINLADSSNMKIFGSPKMDKIKFFRLWFEGIDGEDTIMIYSIKFPQLEWKEISVIDYEDTGEPIDSTESVKIGRVNRETEPDYTSPFYVPKDPTTLVTELESSMKLSYENIKSGHGGIVSKISYDKYDLRNYRKVKFYIHSEDEDLGIFLRLGTDSTNYYEYSTIIKEASKITDYGDGHWYEINFYIDSLALFKYNTGERDDNRIKEGSFAIKGNPSFAEIQYIGVGFWNPLSEIISGEVWFDDIKVLEPRRDVGYALRGNVDLNLGDLASFSMSLSRETGNFVGFMDPLFVKTTGDQWNYTFKTQVNMDKFLPQKARMKIPFVYSKSENFSTSRYSMDANDVFSEVTGEKLPNRTYSEGITVSASRSRYGREPFILKYIINPLSIKYSLSRAHNISTVDKAKDTSFSYSTSISYSVNPELYLKFKNRYLDILPSNISFNVTRLLREDRRYEITDSLPLLLSKTRDNDFNMGAGFTHRFLLLTSTYNFNENRDMDEEKELYGINIGEEAGRSQSISENIAFPLWGIISPSISASGSYSENYSPDIRGDSNFRSVSNRGSITLRSGRLTLPKLWEELTNLFSSKDTTKNKKNKTPGLLKMIIVPQITYQKSRSTSYPFIKERPGWMYQMGLEDSVSGISSLTRGSINLKDSIGIDGGIKPLTNISITLKYGYGKTESYYSGNNRYTENITWPSMDIRWDRIEKLKFIKKVITSASFTLNGANVYSISGDIGKEPESKGYSQSIRPYFTITWKNSMNTNIGLSGTRNITETYDITGTTVSEDRELSGDLTLIYTLKPGEGFLSKKLKLKNPLRIDFTTSHALSQTLINKEGETNFYKDDISSNFTLNTSYRFPGGITGSLQTSYSHNYNRKSGSRTQKVDINISARFNF